MPMPTYTPEQQAALDTAYWHTTRTIADVRGEFGLTVAQLNKAVTPLPTGTTCWWCGAAQHFRSRTDRNDAAKGYSYRECPCGARQPNPPRRDNLVETDAAILAPLFDRSEYTYSYRYGRRDEDGRCVHNASEVVCNAVESLQRSGLRWNGQFTVVDASTTPDALIERLDALPTRVLVLPSLTDAMANEGDSLALFFRLVARGWRVLSAGGRSELTGAVYDGWCDDIAQPWQRLPPAAPERGLRLVPS